jgi:hypothetical protein
MEMSIKPHVWNGHPFPTKRPIVRITPSVHKIEEIPFKELRWWKAIPELGNHTMWASYDAATGELFSVADIVATRLARVHERPCVEMKYREWSLSVKLDEGFLYATIENGQARWVAVLLHQAGAPAALATFLDEHFAGQWDMPYHGHTLADDGACRILPDGSHAVDRIGCYVAGAYDVAIGDNRFHCLRIIDPSPAISEYEELAEAYVDVSGRTVYYRQFRGRYCGSGIASWAQVFPQIKETLIIDWVQIYPQNERLTINGCTYVHCDCSGKAHELITNTGMGVSLA